MGSEWVLKRFRENASRQGSGSLARGSVRFGEADFGPRVLQ